MKSITAVSRCFVIALAVSLFVLIGAVSIHASEILVKDGERISFLGDSITANGWNNSTGYVKLVIAGFKANGSNVIVLPAGISGNKSNQMLKRLKRDVLNKKPDWIIISCGINDVWHGNHGVPLEDYKINMTNIVDKCNAAGVKLVILTTTVIGEDLYNDYNKKLSLYNEFLRLLAKEKKCLLADVNVVFQNVIKAKLKPGYVLTYDGVHLNSDGDKVMATVILHVLGLNNLQIKKAQESWNGMIKRLE